MRRGKLPCAEPVPVPVETFEALRAFVGVSFGIDDMQIVPPPPWTYDLFR